jgi:transposase-like protein
MGSKIRSRRGVIVDKRQTTRLSAEEKLRLVEEGRQAGTTISEVCRRQQLDHVQFYRWEKQSRQGIWKPRETELSGPEALAVWLK